LAITLTRPADDSTASLEENMKYELPKPGLQTKPCTACDGTMEMRLGMWDCKKCGLQESPAPDPIEDRGPDPALSINRAKLLRRPDTTPQTSIDGSYYEAAQEDPRMILLTKVACLCAYVLLVILSHSYVYINGIVDSWVETDFILGRVVTQLVFLFIMAVGLFWREALTKYVAIVISTLVFIALLIRSFVAGGVVVPFDLVESPWLPAAKGLYWYGLTLGQLGLLVWTVVILMKDLPSNERT
jgi:hypothetical protein